MKMDKKIIIFVIVIVIAAGGYLMWRASASTPTNETLGGANTGENQAATGGEQLPLKEVTVTATEFAFSPNEISVKRGQTVRLTVVNNGNYPHDLSIEKLGIKTKRLSRGQTEIMQFTVPAEPGDYPLTAICSVPGHKESGMVFNFKAE